MLEILLPDFKLSIYPLERTSEGAGGPYFDWIKLEVSFETIGIFAKFQWDVMPNELQSFAQQLQFINLHPSSKANATLQGVESGLQISIDGKSDGSLIIIYSIQPTPPDGPKLTGITGADQSYLPDMIAGINKLISFH